MPPNIKVCVNGFVLSTLLFDCANNSGDQEGFLYGSITRNLRREISDQSLTNTQEEILISICSSVPSGSFLSFYNNVGQIKEEEVDFYLGDRRQNVIGWYRYRRYSAMYPSARENAVHRCLRDLFFPDDNPNHQYFVCAILSSSNLTNFATHSYDYAFFTQRRDNIFRPLNTTILNLGDTRNSYRSGSLAMPFMSSASFNSCIETAWNFQSFYEIEDQIQRFHQTLRSKLESLQEELAASDAVNATLEDDIQRLSNELQSLLASQEAFSAEPTYDSAVTLVAPTSGEQSLAASGSSSDEHSEKEVRKRVAELPAEDTRPTKRVCPDKYFGSDTEDEGTNEAVISATPSGSMDGTSFSGSHIFNVDPDNGEASQSSTEKSSDKENEDTSMKEMNLVPSPSSTVEVVISESGLQPYFDSAELEEVSSSPDVSDIRESSSEPASSPKEPSSSNPPPEIELQSEAAAYVIPEVAESTTETSNMQIDSTIITARASSTSEDLSKMTPPFIIYASKKYDEIESCSSHSFEENRQQFVESTSKTVSDDKPISHKDTEKESDSSPTSTTGGDFKETEKIQHNSKEK